MRICTFVVAIALTAAAGAGQASPVTFDLDGPGSSIDYSTQFGGCGSMFDPEPCISADTVTGLGASRFTLDSVGDSHTFDFAQVLFGTTVDGEVGDLEATLAFDSPSGGSVTVYAKVTLLAMAVPEPTAFVLIGLGLLALGVIRARRTQAP